MNYMLKIISLNAYIQHSKSKLTLSGKEVLCVSLDRTCTFEGIGENDIELTDEQLDELFSQVANLEINNGRQI